MKRYRIKQTTKLGEKTLLLTLQPKHASEVLQFFPGQYAAIGFRTGGRPSPVRCFSIVSTPNNRAELQFAMRIQGNFTRAIAKLEQGDEVFVYGPFGDFVIDEYQDKNIILLAAGIGVTPFMSMIRNAAEISLPIPITLLYSNQAQDDIPFYEDLKYYEQVNPRFRAAFFVTRGETDALEGSRVYRGRVDADRLKQVIGGNPNRFTYFVCGPKGFTKAMQAALVEQGAEAERIITEEFTPTTPTETLLAPARHGIQWWTYALTGASLALAAFFFMSLDLVRLVPKASAASTQAASTSNISSNGSSSTIGPDAGSTVSPNQSPPPTVQSPPSPTYNYSYSAPMTSVS